MTKIEELYVEMTNPDAIKKFESDYGMCFLQESARIVSHGLTFGLNHTLMFIHNSYDEDMSDEEYLDFTHDYVYFDDFGKGIEGLPFDCTEEEFNAVKLNNSHIVYSDMKVLETMYKNFEKYLDMDAVKRYSK